MHAARVNCGAFAQAAASLRHPLSECGPACACAPTCGNRQSSQGLQFAVEVCRGVKACSLLMLPAIPHSQWR